MRGPHPYAAAAADAADCDRPAVLGQVVARKAILRGRGRGIRRELKPARVDRHCYGCLCDAMRGNGDRPSRRLKCDAGLGGHCRRGQGHAAAGIAGIFELKCARGCPSCRHPGRTVVESAAVGAVRKQAYIVQAGEVELSAARERRWRVYWRGSIDQRRFDLRRRPSAMQLAQQRRRAADLCSGCGSAADRGSIGAGTGRRRSQVDAGGCDINLQRVIAALRPAHRERGDITARIGRAHRDR